MSRSVSAVSMATSEYCSCPPRVPTPTASHVAIASGVNHRVTSPRWTSARSYAGQFPTRYFVVYLGCTLDFTSRACPFGRHDGQGRDEHLLPRTNADARGATGVVPPTKTARVSRRRPRSSARDHTINTVKSIGRRRWTKTSRYHQHARVENAFFRYKSIIGDGLRARTPGGRTVEAQLACNMLNAMTDMGRPASYAVGR